MISAQPFYCSLLSSEDGEETFGTASVGDVWLLVEYASVWKPKALEGSALSDEVKSHLGGLLKTIPRSRLLFIKQGRDCGEYLNFFVIHSRELKPFVVRFDLSNYEDLRGVDVAAAVRGETAGGVLHEEPLYLVCTHSRRDKCCAKFGLPIYKSLRATAGARVWQSSHVGGDRFAANVVCFPHGLFYARATEVSAGKIVSEYEAGRIVIENFRGRACYGYPVQAAEFFVRRESGLVGVEALRHAGTERAGASARRVRFTDAEGETIYEALVNWRESDFRNYITCHSTEEKSVTQYALAEYHATSARTLAQA